MPGQNSFHTRRQDRSVKNAEWGKQRHTPPLQQAFPTVLSDMPHGPAKRLRIKPPPVMPRSTVRFPGFLLFQSPPAEPIRKS